MNLYIVVEGEVEKEVYPAWISDINPEIKYVNDISEIVNDHYAILSGGGYPFYWRIIENAIEDVNNHGGINRLVLSADSEDMTREEKLQEFLNRIDGFRCNAEIFIIIQHFCIETWALANRVLIRRHPTDLKLLEYMKFFNVTNSDPELLPAYKDLNRSQFALKYLKCAVNDRNPRMTYSKKSPWVLTQGGSFGQIVSRFEETGHIPSLRSFIDAFV